MKHVAAALARLSPPLRVFLFLAGLALLWLPFALPLYWLAATGRLALGGAIATGLLYVGFLAVWPTWARHVHQLPHPWQTLGLTLNSGVVQDWLTGLSLGLGGIAALVGIELLEGWATPNPPAQLLKIGLEGGLVSLAVGLAEELLFRGWLLFELEQGLSTGQALVGVALIFAIAHFIKPLPDLLATLPQFFGLFLLGLTLVWARRSPSHARPLPRTALGYPIGLHSGLVWGYYLLNVGQVAKISGTVPDWVTGIQGNPLAGMLGLGLLGGLAALFYRSAHRSR